MSIRLGHILAISLISAALPLGANGTASAAAVAVELRAKGDGWQLVRDGQPYFIQGAGGDGSKEFLKACGGNSFRTWGADDIGNQLDLAQKLGLTVTVGFWLGQERHHFDYTNADQVAAQYERCRQAVLKYKDHPAVLMWSIGNEMEGYAKGDNAAIWMAVQNIAAMAHKLDPKHPTMTIIAEVGGDRVKNINRFCPDIDIVGMNSYGGGPSLASRYRAAGGIKPFVITEFGPAGTWETGKNSWDVPIELTSTAKAAAYRATYEQSVLAEKNKLCLGSYVFAWGNKQEATATWYGLFLSDGTRLESIDTMTELWSGHAVSNRCPQLTAMKPVKERLEPGETVHVSLSVSDPEHDPLKVKWVLSKDFAKYDTGGDTQSAPPVYPESILKSDALGADIKMPTNGGGYWLYAYVYDDHGGAAVADVPLLVNGPEIAPPARMASLPLILYADGVSKLPYIWSGWMGDYHAIAIDEKCTDRPHSGATCMKAEFRAPRGFGGVVWQDPPDDWGNAPGGLNITGAKKLSFSARGDQGGEKVSFKLGIIGKDKKFHDSDEADLNNVILSTDWKQYEINLAGKDLSCIKTGFVWVLGANGKPVTFYLDDVRYE